MTITALKGALCSFGEEIQTLVRTLLKARNVAGSAKYKQSKTV